MALVRPSAFTDTRQFPANEMLEGMVSHEYINDIKTYALAPAVQNTVHTITFGAVVASTTYTLSGIVRNSSIPYSFTVNSGTTITTVTQLAAAFATLINTSSNFGYLYRASSLAGVLTLESLIAGQAGDHTIALNVLAGNTVATVSPSIASAVAGTLVYTDNAQTNRQKLFTGAFPLTAFTGLTLRGYLADSNYHPYNDYTKTIEAYRPIPVARSAVIALRPVTAIAPGQTINADCSVNGRGRPTSAAVAGNILAYPSTFQISLAEGAVAAGQLGWFRINSQF